MPVDISNKSYAISELRHYSPAYFNGRIANKILGTEGVNWNNAPGQQSCAMRLSIALAYAGVVWPRIRNSWKLKDTQVYFPSSAGDYPDLLAKGEAITSAKEIVRRHGVIYFGGTFASASGHVTLWNGSHCHFHDAYWEQPVKRFWPML